MTDPDALESAHHEEHYVTRGGWLRAAVLGANDGLLSTASLMVGMAGAAVPQSQLVMTGVAGIVAGALSMAAGEYVSVSSQADAERADLRREAAALDAFPDEEHRELAAIYRERGLPDDLAEEVARRLAEHDAVAAHARDELGITETTLAKPVQAALASALSFLVGGLPPLAATLMAGEARALTAIVAVSVTMLGVLGVLGARAGGAPPGRATLRVVGFGVLAMAVTFAVGRLFHAAL